MESSASESQPLVASWNTALGTTALADLDNPKWAYKLPRAAEAHMKAEPRAANDDQFLAFLAQAHQVYFDRGEYETAHRFGVYCYRLDRDDVGASLVRDSAYHLAQEELAKARIALEEKNYRRASDKGVWAGTHFADAMRAGRSGAEAEFYEAAAVTFEGNAYYGGDVDRIEVPLLADCDDVGIPKPLKMLAVIRLKAYEAARTGDDLEYQAQRMLRHSTELGQLGIEVPRLVCHAALLSINNYLHGNGGAGYACSEGLKALEAQEFPAGELHKIRLAVAQHRYDAALRSAQSNNPDRDIAAYKWFGVAGDCVELIKLGDEPAKDNLLTALEQQIETLDTEYFTYSNESSINVHFDRYAEAGLITNEKNTALKQALQKKLSTIRNQFLEESTDEDDWWRQEVTERIDATIRGYT